MGQYDDVFILNPQELLNNNYKHISDNIYTDINLFKTVINAIKTTTNDKNVLIVIDNVHTDNKTINWISDLIAYHHNSHNMTLVISLQYPVHFPPVIRNKIDFVHLFQENLRDNIRKIHNNYCGMFPDFHEFKQVFSQVTENYCRLMIDNTTSHAGIYDFNDQVRWRKCADVVPIKHLMSEETKKLNEQLQSGELNNTNLHQNLKDINEAIDKLVKVRNNIKLMLEKN